MEVHGDRMWPTVNIRCEVCQRRHPRGVTPAMGAVYMPDITKPSEWKVVAFRRQAAITPHLPRKGSRPIHMNAVESLRFSQLVHPSGASGLTESKIAEIKEMQSEASVPRAMAVPSNEIAHLACRACRNRPRRKPAGLKDEARDAYASGRLDIYA